MLPSSLSHNFFLSCCVLSMVGMIVFICLSVQILFLMAVCKRRVLKLSLVLFINALM